MKIQGEAIASLSRINGTSDHLVHLLWKPDGTNLGVGYVVCTPTADNLSSWREAVMLWNKGRCPTPFSSSAYDELTELCGKLLSKAITDTSRGVLS